MNCSVYIIGADRDGVMHAYPDDYAMHDIFERFSPFLKEESLLAIHRNGSLFYHIWYRKTSEGYFGICVLINGMWFSQTDILMRLFESAFSLAAIDGQLLRVDNDGHIRTTAGAFAHNKNGINKIDLYVKENISLNSKYCITVPPQNASTDPLAIQSLQHDASPQLFAKTLETYRSVCATYGTGDGNVNVLLQRIEDMANVRDEYGNKCKQLEAQCKSIEKSKNRYATVVFLTCLMLIGSIVAIGVIGSKNKEIERQLATIQDNEETISSQEYKISSQKNTINEQSQSITRLENRIENLESTNEELQSTISTFNSERTAILSHKPFTVTHTEFSWERGVLTVHYYATNGGTRDVRCKVIRESDNAEMFDYSYTLKRSTSSGNNSFTLSSLTGLSSSNWYRFEIYSNGNFCGGGRH